MKWFLSKMKIMHGLQCQKRLWLEVHRSELAVYSQSSHAVMASGTSVGKLAREQYPGGELLENDLSGALWRSKRLLDRRANKPLFEAAFKHDNVIARADILVPRNSGYDMYEVKSSTSVKSHYYQDLAIQSWLFRKAGYPLGKSCITHLDNQFVYSMPDDYHGLFTSVDVTEEVTDLYREVPHWIRMCRDVLDGDMPEADPGPHCDKPNACPFVNHCHVDPGVDYPVSTLPYGGKFVQRLLERGIEDIRDIPEAELRNPSHRLIWKTVRAGQATIDPVVKAVIDALPYPRYFIDFETINPAVPMWLGTRPYQQVPFQWSCHVQHADGDLVHHGFLDVSGGSPMEAFTKTLVDLLGEEGSIIVYNEAFETARLKEMARLYPAYQEKIDAILSRVVDLLPITRKHFYDPSMNGSWSIKSVLPAIDDTVTYTDLDVVHGGTEAQQAYLEAINPATTNERKAELKAALWEYCKLDTLAMVSIIDRLGA